MRLFAKALSAGVATCLVLSMCPAMAFAEAGADTGDEPSGKGQVYTALEETGDGTGSGTGDGTGDGSGTGDGGQTADPQPEKDTITAFEVLAGNVATQTVTVGTAAGKLKLPELKATVRPVDATQPEKTITVKGSWDTSAYNAAKAGTCTLKFTIADSVKSEYEIADSIAPPTITVVVEKNATKMSVAAKPTGGKKDSKGVYTITLKATKTPSIKIKVDKGGKRKAKLYRKDDGEWKAVGKKYVYELAAGDSSKTLAIKFPKKWYAPLKTTWKLEVPENSGYKAASITFKTVAKRVYQNPKRYFQIKEEVPTRETTYNLKYGMSGYKVYLLQKRLGIYSGHSKFGPTTRAAVKRFQRKHGLKATGVVNLETWLEMGFSEHKWYYADSYVSPIRITAKSTKKQCIAAMVKRAKQYLGTRYVWCAAAKPKQGIDCAGLVIQALYAAGIDPLPSGSHVYAYAKNEYTTARMWHNKKFKHVSFGSRKRGDLICYYGHVAIALSRSTMIEALPSGGVQISSIRTNNLRGVIRPFV